MPEPRVKNILFVLGRSADPNLYSGTLDLAEALVDHGREVRALFASRRLPKLGPHHQPRVPLVPAGEVGNWLSHLLTLSRAAAVCLPYC